MKLNWNIMKQTLDLDEVESALGISVLTSGDDEDVARCPLPSHAGVDTNPSFAINRNKLVYNCFTCGEGGSLAQLVMEIEGLEWSEALEWLRPYCGSLTKEDPEKFVQHIKRILYLDEEQGPATMPYFKPSVLKPWLNGPFDYYIERGIDEATCRRLRLGYDANYVKYNPKAKQEWHGEAAIIPHFFEGNLVGYQSRIVGDKPLGLPKYDNTAGFPKAETIYNYDMARLTRDTYIHVCESALTAAYILSLGYMAVATFGAQVADEQWRLLRIFKHLVLCFDNDKAGHQCTREGIAALRRHTNLYIIPPVEEVEKGDLLDLTPEHAVEQMKLRVPAHLYDYYLG